MRKSRSQKKKESRRSSLISQFFKPKSKKITPSEKSNASDTTKNTPKITNEEISPAPKEKQDLEAAQKSTNNLSRFAVRKKLDIEYEDNDNAIKIGTKEIRRENGTSAKTKPSNLEEIIGFDELFGKKDFEKMKEESDEEAGRQNETLGELAGPGKLFRGYKGNKVFAKGRDGKYKYFKKITLNNIKVKDNNLISFEEGKEIYFPYDAYPQQKEFINSLYNAIDKGENALLESPTGTGKTLSILTGALGWLYKKHSEKENLDTKIFYASRTHSQIKQLIKELKSTCYQPIVAILGSRDQLCINKELSDCSGSEKNNRCSNLVSMGECSFHKNLEKNSKMARNIYSKKILDIEDLVTEGSSEGFCPFYLMRNMIKDAHIVFLPYNYLTHKAFRFMLEQHLEESVVIFDEGHNIESVAEDGNSIEFKGNELEKTIEDFGKLFNLLNRNEQSSQSLSKLQQKIENITKTISDLNKHLKEKIKGRKYFSQSFKGEEIFNVFGELLKGTGLFSPNLQFNIVDSKQLGMNMKNKFMENLIKNAYDISLMVRKAQSLLRAMSIGFPYVEKWAKFLEKLIKLNKNFNEKAKINAIWSFRDINHFSLTIEKIFLGYRKIDVKMRMDCLTPKFTLNQISAHKPKSIVFTSGTLQPMDDYEQNFGIPFPTKFSCGHVISTGNQLKVAVIKNLSGKIKANFSYHNRSNQTLIDELGNFIYRMAQITPKGMIIFFPSYKVMETYHERWKSKRLLQNIKKLKVICKEERNQKKFRSSFNRFLSNYQTRGAIFFGVTSGKLSEGIDFTDEMARMVIMVGVPFPNMLDPKIKNKKVYLDQLKKEKIQMKVKDSKKMFGGDRWYFVSALRATNQAIGRIIRHKKDFGSIILVDERYSYGKFKNEISGWVSKEMNIFQNSDDSVNKIKMFYEKAEKFCSKFETRQKLKGKSLQQRILESGNINKIELEKIKNLKRDGSKYVSLDVEKELKRTKRNSFYTKKEKIKKKMKIEISNVESDDDIEEVEGNDAPKPFLFRKKSSEKFINVIEDNNEDLKRVSTSDKLDFISDLYQQMNPKERIVRIEKEKMKKLHCLICYVNPSEPRGAKCGHIACKSCWEQQLSLNKLECPACRKKVRKKNLIIIEEKPEIISI